MKLHSRAENATKNRSITNTVMCLSMYIKPYRLYFGISIIALVLSTISVLLLSQSIKRTIDSGLTGAAIHLALKTELLYMFAIVGIIAVAAATRSFFITLLGERVSGDIKLSIYKQILRLSSDFFETHSSSEILSRLAKDTALLYQIMSSSLSTGIRNVLLMIGSLILMVIQNPKLSTIALITTPSVLVPIILMARRSRKSAKLLGQHHDRLTTLADEAIANIKTIQAYAQEDWETIRFEKSLADDLQATKKHLISRAALTVSSVIFAFSAVISILWIGGQDVLNGHMTPGQLSSFLFLAVLCASSTGTLMEVIQSINKAYGISEGIMDFLNLQPTELHLATEENLTNPSLKYTNPLIEFRNVHFHYSSRPEKPVLQGLCIEVMKGEIIAIVGESGIGKSTIFELLLRFYQPLQGDIYYDGINAKELDLKYLRRKFGYVSQSPSIFSNTIHANIAYGNPTATTEEVAEAAKQAAALQFIEALPEKFDTFVGEKGLRLSAGQKQRILIARAILSNPEVLLLDEITSALDTKNESIVKETINKMRGSKTCLIIAHRLSTVIDADRIFVLHDGKIVESGTHKELVSLQKHYVQLLYKKGLDMN